MITQTEFERLRQLKGKFVNYWLDESMTSEELAFLIENVSHKTIVKTEYEELIAILTSSSW